MGDDSSDVIAHIFYNHMANTERIRRSSSSAIRRTKRAAMALERYLKTLDFAFRQQDGTSVAIFLGANSRDIPYSNDFVPYLFQVHEVKARAFKNSSPTPLASLYYLYVELVHLIIGTIKYLVLRSTSYIQ